MTDKAVKASLSLAANFGGGSTAEDDNAGFSSLDNLKKHLIGEEVAEPSQAEKANAALAALTPNSVQAEADIAEFFGEETVGTGQDSDVKISITISGGKVQVS